MGKMYLSTKSKYRYELKDKGIAKKKPREEDHWKDILHNV